MDSGNNLADYDNFPANSVILERRGLPVSGYLIPIGKRYNLFFCRFSSGETGANLIYTFLTSSKKFAPIQKVSPSQSCSHRNSVQNGPIERSTALMATLFVKKHKIDPDPKKMSSSQSCSHRNSVQNGPVDKFTALMATLFVNISVFMSRGPKVQGFCGMRYPDTYTICRYAVSDIYLFLLRHLDLTTQPGDMPVS